jgi:hypothetical protein
LTYIILPPVATNNQAQSGTTTALSHCIVTAG